MSLRPLLALALAASTLAACGDDGSSGGFDADPGPIDSQLIGALDEGADPEAVPEVQRNFLDGCIKGFEDAVPELEPVQAAGLVQVCGCSYDRIVEHSYDLGRDVLDDLVGENRGEGDGQGLVPDELDEAAFEVFTGIEDDLRAGESLDDEILTLLRGCIRDEAGL